MSEAPLVYTVNEVAELTGCGRSTIYDAIRRDELPGVLRLGRRILISKAALHAALELTDANLLGGQTAEQNGTRTDSRERTSPVTAGLAQKGRTFDGCRIPPNGN